MILVVVLVVSGCGPASAPATDEPAFGPTFARDSAMAAIWTEGEPMPALDWSEEDLTPQDLVGSSTIRYTAGEWAVTVVYPIVAPDLTVYQVDIGNSASGLTWSGEVDAQFASLGSISGFMEQGHGIPVMFTAQKPVPGYENVPLIQNVVKDKSYQPVIDLLFTVSLLGRPFAAPPGIPAERLKILQEAFYKAMHDNEAIKISQKAGRPLDYVSGEDAQKMAKSILEVSPQVVKLVKEAYGVK